MESDRNDALRYVMFHSGWATVVPRHVYVNGTIAEDEMSSLRQGDIVKVLASGYSLPPEVQAVVVGFNSSGVEVGNVRWGFVQEAVTIPAFALRKVTLPQAEMIWNRIRHKEDMILRAMTVWGIKEVRLKATTVVGQLYKAVIVWQDKTLEVRAGTLGEVLKTAFMLGYFLRVSSQTVKEVQSRIQELLNAVEELVRSA